MRSALISDAEAQRRLEASTSGLADTTPMVSARTILSLGQKRVFLVAALVIVASVIVAPTATVIGLITVITAAYVAVSVYRVVLFVKSADPGVVLTVTDAQARATPDADLPVYTGPGAHVPRDGDDRESPGKIEPNRSTHTIGWISRSWWKRMTMAQLPRWPVPTPVTTLSSSWFLPANHGPNLRP